MFTNIKAYNFRSFDNIEFDLSRKNHAPKNLAIIYGENGAGKSNLLSTFVFLDELLRTMDVRDVYEQILNQKFDLNDMELENKLRQRLMLGLRDIQAIIADYGMVGCDQPITLEYEFSIGGKNGVYIIKLLKDQIIHERLEYLLNRRKGIYFDCKNEDISINPAIITDKEFLAELKASARKFWGKHSLLAIILHEIYDKSKTFAWENISDNFLDVISELTTISCSVGIGDRRWNGLAAPRAIPENPISGSIDKDEENKLDIAQDLFSLFFSAINSDIKSVYYDKKYNDNIIDYRLYFEEYIAGSYRNIPFDIESTGTHQLLEILCNLLMACTGNIVVIDEADSGIHDLLFQKIIQEILPALKGQLIISTHNTLLMESDIPNDVFYFIFEESAGHKTIRCLNDYGKRIYTTNNIRNKYLNGEYGGLPEIEKVDFQELIMQIVNQMNEEGKSSKQ